LKDGLLITNIVKIFNLSKHESQQDQWFSGDNPQYVPFLDRSRLSPFLTCSYQFNLPGRSLPAPYSKKYGKHPAIKAFVNGIAAAAIGAIAGAVIVLAKRTLTDIPTVLIALATAAMLLRFKKLQEPYVILAAACLGILLKALI